MRHIQSNSQDTAELDQAHLELESVQGRIASAHIELSAIIGNKKRIESDFEEEKKKLDAQIELKKEEVQGITNVSAKFLHTTAFSQREAELARDKAIEERVQSEKDLDSVRVVVTNQTGKKEALDEVVKNLVSTEQRLRSSISHLAPQERTLEAKKTKLSQEVADIEKKIAELTTAHVQTHTAHEEEKVIHASIVEMKGTKQKEVDELKEKFTSLSRLISSAEVELADIQKKRSEQETAMQEREREANERLSAATRLEQHVDAKLAQLRNVEGAFTTEHLARMGYQK